MTITVAVTGTGGGVGQSILKSLQKSPYRVLAMNADPLAPGLYAADRGYRVPSAADPAFIDHLIEICRRENAKALLPGLDPELPVIAANAERFRAAGIIPIVSRPDVIAIADDKQATANFLRRHGFPTPTTVPLTAFDTGINAGTDANTRAGEGMIRWPMVLKPMQGGSRSQGVHLVRTPAEFEALRPTLDAPNYVAQEYIDGDEYTCGSLTVGGRCHGAIVMRRTLRSGDTFQAFVVDAPTIRDTVCAVANALQPFGPCNFQLRLRDGVPVIFEINARCSGTTHARTLAGFNEPQMALDYLLCGHEPTYRIREITVLRYWNEFVADNDQIETFKRTGAVDGRRAGL